MGHLARYAHGRMRRLYARVVYRKHQNICGVLGAELLTQQVRAELAQSGHLSRSADGRDLRAIVPTRYAHG